MCIFSKKTYLRNATKTSFILKIAVLTGAGVSAESGLKTFRDSNGLWEGHDVMEVASPQGFHKNPADRDGDGRARGRAANAYPAPRFVRRTA